MYFLWFFIFFLFFFVTSTFSLVIFIDSLWFTFTLVMLVIFILGEFLFEMLGFRNTMMLAFITQTFLLFTTVLTSTVLLTILAELIFFVLLPFLYGFFVCA